MTGTAAPPAETEAPPRAQKEPPSPFLRGLPEPLPEHQLPAVQELRRWLSTQPHLPPLTDEHLHLFLHSCYGNLEPTKKTIEMYFTVRTQWTDLFSNRDPLLPEIECLMDLAHLMQLPQPTPEGYRVMLYRLVNPDASRLHFGTAVKAFCMYNDMQLSEDGLVPGYVVVFDMAGVHLGHLARVSLAVVRKFMIYIQDCHPVRLKGVHVINTVGFIDKVLALVKPFLKSEIIKLLHFHGPVTSLGKFLPLDILPEEYGGTGGKCQELADKYRTLLRTSYRSFLMEEEVLRVDESKRPPKQSWWQIFWGSDTNSLQQLSLD
ncbi:retinol-binding protein pinta-like [Schistocerca americana]|uniref:retinol-binding protein pinta-like n=1 Tax=Schistocerca americana TaxID=7009 RepID=UPI001F4F3CF3|nr:retinol-binding protein pinta-like [Schistocerca americana]